jgi:hypothetical protein
MTLSSRRRAIYTGLSCYLAYDELLSAVALWESKYADKPSFALNEFIAELASGGGRKLERARVYRELVGALTGPVAALLPDPEALLTSWRERMQHKSGAAAASPSEEALRTLEVLSGRLFQAMDAGLLTRLRSFVTGNLSVMNGSNEQRLHVRNWLEQNQSLEGVLLSLTQLRQLLNLIYVGMCEYLGPVEADRRLSQAVHLTDAEQLPFAARQLL